MADRSIMDASPMTALPEPEPATEAPYSWGKTLHGCDGAWLSVSHNWSPSGPNYN